MNTSSKPAGTDYRRIAQIALGAGIFILATCLIMAFARGSLSLHFGLLPTSSDSFLDGSGRVYQTIDWHTAEGEHGRTYGLKLSRAYASVQISH